MTAKELELMLDERIAAAYKSGISVVEITRTIRQVKVNYVLGILRRDGHIEPFPDKAFCRSYDIDWRLEKSLKYRGISFGRWCIWWKFDPDEAAIALQEPPASRKLGIFHEAMKRDFPQASFSIFGGDEYVKSPYNPLAMQHTVVITRDASQSNYIAQVAELPGIEGMGYSWAKALENLTAMYRIHEGIRMLNEAINKAGKARIQYPHNGNSLAVKSK